MRYRKYYAASCASVHEGRRKRSEGNTARNGTEERWKYGAAILLQISHLSGAKFGYNQRKSDITQNKRVFVVY